MRTYIFLLLATCFLFLTGCTGQGGVRYEVGPATSWVNPDGRKVVRVRSPYQESPQIPVVTKNGSLVLTGEPVECRIPDGSIVGNIYSEEVCAQLVAENKLYLTKLALEKERAKRKELAFKIKQGERQKIYQNEVDRENFCKALYSKNPRAWCQKCPQVWDWEKLQCMMHGN